MKILWVSFYSTLSRIGSCQAIVASLPLSVRGSSLPPQKDFREGAKVAKEHFLGRAKEAKVGRLSANPKMTSVHSLCEFLFVCNVKSGLHSRDVFVETRVMQTVIQRRTNDICSDICRHV